MNTRRLKDSITLLIAGYHHYQLVQSASHASFHSVVVITLASHARGPGFEPQWKQEALIFSVVSAHLTVYDNVLE